MISAMSKCILRLRMTRSVDMLADAAVLRKKLISSAVGGFGRRRYRSP